MSNVKTGDLAIIVDCDGRWTTKVGQIVEVGIQAVGHAEIKCTDGSIYHCPLRKNYLHWWVLAKEPVEITKHQSTGRVRSATFFPCADEYLRKISGLDTPEGNDIEVFTPGPINSEERVRIRDAKIAKFKKLVKEEMEKNNG